MEKTKRILVTMDIELFEEAKAKSEKVMGRRNLSGLINVLLKKFINETK